MANPHADTQLAKYISKRIDELKGVKKQADITGALRGSKPSPIHSCCSGGDLLLQSHPDDSPESRRASLSAHLGDLATPPPEPEERKATQRLSK